MSKERYWLEVLAEMFDEHGVSATAEQLAAVARDVQGASENIGQAFYEPGPYYGELEDAQKELAAERAKVRCMHCRGSGRNVTNGPYHSANSECWKCHGEGKHAP